MLSAEIFTQHAKCKKDKYINFSKNKFTWYVAKQMFLD